MQGLLSNKWYNKIEVEEYVRKRECAKSVFKLHRSTNLTAIIFPFGEFFAPFFVF